MGSSQTRARTRVPCIGRQMLNHCATREAQPTVSFFFLRVFFFNLFILISLFLAALGLCCCTQAFSSCGKQGLLFVTVRGLLIGVASLVAEHGL